MKYNFDNLIDRHGTKSTKWDYIQDRFGTNDVLPFSLADVDFPCFPGIVEAIEKRLKIPNFGYSRWNNDEYYQAIINWHKNDPMCECNDLNPEWIVYSPSVIYTMSALIKEFSCPGDTIATFNPMYDAFFRVVQDNDRVLHKIELKGPDGGYSFDMDEVKKAIKKPDTKIFILTNPHNPTGYVFSKEELYQIYEMCKTHDVFLISDDIHQGINHGKKKYFPITNFIENDFESKPTMAVLNSTSKTFNVAGLGGSFAFIPNKELKEAYLHHIKDKDMVNSAICMSVEAAIAGYNDGLDYVLQMREYIRSNFELMTEFFNNNNLGIQCEIPDATYLAWLNVIGTDLSEDELQDKLINKGKVGILKGSIFGNENYLRMNIGCPKSMLKDGLNRIKIALA